MLSPCQNYLNNKDILLEIHKSKCSYSSFTDPEYQQYDIILPSLDKINIRTTAEAKRNKAKRLSAIKYTELKNSGEKIKLTECEVNWKKVLKTDVVFRIMTFDHIPTNNVRKKTPKTVADHHERVNFPPFQHWKFNEANELICVGKSHWKGDVDTGEFCINGGNITDTLARMMLKLCERYGTRSNVRGYTYNDEMRGHAILQLTKIGLQFNEAKSNNPFAYFTTAVEHSFVQVMNIEKRNQNIRDDILEMNGMTPSYTRTGNAEYYAGVRRNEEFDD